MKRINAAAIAKADDKPRAAAIEMIKTPLWLIEQILLKHETATIEVMKELHDENMRLRTAILKHQAEVRYASMPAAFGLADDELYKALKVGAGGTAPEGHNAEITGRASGPG